MYQPKRQGDQARLGAQGNASLRPPLGTINVIFAIPRRIGSHPSRVMFVTQLPVEDPDFDLKKARVEIQPALSFLDDDKIRTIQPHDAALVVTLKIGGYAVKR